MKWILALAAGGLICISCLLLIQRDELGDEAKNQGALSSRVAASSVSQSGIQRVSTRTPRALKSTEKGSSASALFGFDQSTAILRNDPNDPEQLLPEASELGSVELAPEIEIDHVLALLGSFRSVANAGCFPTGFNYEITNALLGKNKKKIAFISEKNVRINEEGELTDKWGSPYFFHAESSTKMEVRSAGEDRKMFTDDDVSSYRM
ncbi:hypothetical protein [Rubritalea sp.]|uniref:hypothetical protein n=1 Tax=Rubritalea sp. TaxID=2109375 RepID=UPI003EF16CB7